MSVGQVLLPGRVVDDAPRRKPWSPALAWGERLVRAAEPRVVERSGAVAITERIAVFVVPLGVYLWAAWVLMIDHLSQQLDAGSRLANGYYVFFGKDPHLAAIGFVWQPLTSVAEMPLMALSGVYPDLTRLAFDANIMGAIFMAGAAYQTFRFFEDLGLAWWARWGLTLLTFGNPIVLYYGANGMSEALFILTLTATVRSLARWLDSGRTRSLLSAATWLGLAYGTRNESLASALAAGVLVFAVTAARADGERRSRLLVALTDACLFLAPFILVFVGWAVTSYIIVGHFFAQLSSQYGNSAQVATLGARGGRGALFHAAIGMTMALAPLLPLGLIAGAGRAVRSRDLRFGAPLSILGGVLAFELLAYTGGQLNPFERYFIYGIPLLAMTAACAAAPPARSALERAEQRLADSTGREPRFLAARRSQRRLVGSLMGSLAVAVMVPGVFTTAHEMWSTYYGGVDRQQLQFVLFPHSAAAKASPVAKLYPGVLQFASQLDALHAPRGSVLVDDFDEDVPQTILASRDPGQFFIPNDQGWEETFGVPYQFGVRYIIVTNPAMSGSTDGLDQQFPGLYATGQGLGSLVFQKSIPFGPTFRVYRLFKSSS